MKKKSLKVIAILSLTAGTAAGLAQTTSTSTQPTSHAKPHRKVRAAPPSLQKQLEEVRSQLQGEIDELKAEVRSRDTQLQAMQASNQAAQQAAQQAVAATASTDAQVQSVDNHVQKNDAAVTTLQTSVSTLQTQTTTVQASVQQVQTTAEKIQKSIDEPLSIHYKGVTLTPGGFVAGESVYRQRALASDIYTPWNTTPYASSGEAHISEWVPTARQSRLSVLGAGKVPFGELKGYFESDFLSAGSTSNNLQSNSYTLRIRQAWGQASFHNAKFTAGQTFSLLTENKKGTEAGQEAVTLTPDGDFHVGFTYIRQTGFRLQDSFASGVTVAVALENSQYQFSASNAPTNFFFGAPGNAGGLNNSLANYTHQVSPDVIAKVTYDTGTAHFELGGIARFFRDRYYPTAVTTTAQNDTRLGGGFAANARFTVVKKADLGLHLVAGDGTGRYGASLLPDITVRPDGTLSPLHNAQGLFSLEVHPTKKLDLFGYAGTEYVQRTTYRNAAGVLVGYAPITGNNSGCSTEPLPTAGTGYAPGASTCLGATRFIVEGTAGWTYRLYTGPAGRLQYSLAYSYLTREGWAGVGGAPKATNNFVYTSVRYYIP